MTEDDPYEGEPPEGPFVRCLLCGQRMELVDFDIHAAEECDGVGYEREAT